ncbi:MAG TPA: molybdopterin-dependent oxidoreductase, partial [Planctomycetota bacterium]|nr:molybdopterin-dependent oxidoreductase [Planctomycetota bacterium]
MSPSAAPSSAASHRVPTACPMDCPDSCSLDAEVRDGRVVALHATPAHALTAGDGAPFFCSKMSRYPERSRGPDRLGVPLRRVGRKGEARFEPVGWDAALDLVAARLDAVRRVRGGDAILPYHYDGSNGVFAHDAVDGALWRSLGAVETLRTLCAAPATGAATEMYGKFPGVAFQDYVEARTVVLWGCNPSVSNTHLAPHLLAARRAGAAFVAVDPRRTPFAATADLHLRLRPGSDLAVALWLIAETERRGRLAADFLRAHAKNHESLLARARPWTAERAAAAADVDVRDLARFADLYLDRSPAVIRVGWGMERNRNGDGAM